MAAAAIRIAHGGLDCAATTFGLFRSCDVRCLSKRSATSTKALQTVVANANALERITCSQNFAGSDCRPHCTSTHTTLHHLCDNSAHPSSLLSAPSSAALRK